MTNNNRSPESDGAPRADRLRGKGVLYEQQEQICTVRYNLTPDAGTSPSTGDPPVLKGTISSGRDVVDFRNFFRSDQLVLELEDGRRLPIVFEDPRAGTIRSTGPPENPG